MASSVRQPSLRVNRRGGPHTWLVQLSGVIDESFDPEAFAGLGGVILFDFQNVTRVTSFGIREWVFALQALQADYYGFINCRPPVVSEFNMVKEFAGRGELISFYVPFICPTCDHEFEVFIDLRSAYDMVASFGMPEARCAVDGHEAEMDEYPEQYFAHAAGHKRPTPPPVCDELIAGKLPVQGPKLRIRKEVSGEVTMIYLIGSLTGKVRVRRAFRGLEGVVVLDLREVSEVSDEGLEAIAAAVQESCPRLHIAGVAERHAYEFEVRMPDAAIVSLIATVNCPGCDHLFKAEAFGAVIEETCEQGAAELVCPACGRRQQWSAAVRSTLSAVPPAVFNGLSRPRTRTDVLPAITSATGERRRYEIVRRIGAGGMAEVFLARQTGLHGFEKTVVLKRILPEHARERHAREMFVQEARVAARISHPNVVQIFDLGEERNDLFIAMEYIDGWSLRQVLFAASRADQAMPVGIACAIVAQLCTALHAAHTTLGDDGEELGIVHRDVSPTNILITRSGVVKLADFGVAKVQNSLIRTRPGTQKGKIPYMAPEQVKGQEAYIGPHTDVFATGIVLYECLAGQRPFDGRAAYEIMRAIVRHSPPDILTLRSEVSQKLARVVRGALARDIPDRYGNASRLADAIDEVIAEEAHAPTVRDIARWIASLSFLADGTTPGSEHSDDPSHDDETATITVVDPEEDDRALASRSAATPPSIQPKR